MPVSIASQAAWLNKLPGGARVCKIHTSWDEQAVPDHQVSIQNPGSAYRQAMNCRQSFTGMSRIRAFVTPTSSPVHLSRMERSNARTGPTSKSSTSCSPTPMRSISTKSWQMGALSQSLKALSCLKGKGSLRNAPRTPTDNSCNVSRGRRHYTKNVTRALAAPGRRSGNNRPGRYADHQQHGGQSPSARG